MARNNKTIDRIQAIWKMIGGDAGADDLIAGRAKLMIEVVKPITELTRFRILGALSNLHSLFESCDFRMTDGFRKHISAHIDLVRAASNPGEFGHYADVTRVSTHDELRAQFPEYVSCRDVNELFKKINRMIVYDNPELLQDGRSNIFYVEIENGEEINEVAERFCVSIYRDNGEWIFSLFDWARERGSNVSVGSRVFYFPEQD